MADSGTVYIGSGSPKKEAKREVKKQVKKLNKLASETSNTIYELSSLFPFQLFPDHIVIDENKVTIIRKEIFFKRVFPILLKDLLTVKVNRGIFFASMEFEIKRLEQNPSSTNFLIPSEAALAQKYIMGLIQAKREGVDMSKMTREQILKRLRWIGEDKDGAGTLF